MTTSKRYENQKYFWEYAGHIGYGKAIFSNRTVERHIISKQWQTAIHTANTLGLDRNSTVLELGCGDGTFAENILVSHFGQIDAFDISESAIRKARSQSTSKNVCYHAEDLTTYDYDAKSYWDGAFLIGFFHHVKYFTSMIVSRLAKVCPNVIVLEPNGDNVIRKGLELLPSYKLAGEESFRLKQLMNIFNSKGYKAIVIHRINLIPPFLPEILFPALKRIESIVEPNPFLNRLCSSYVIGFKRAAY